MGAAGGWDGSIKLAPNGYRFDRSFLVATAACGADSIAHPASATARYKMQEGKLSLTPRKKKMAALSLLLITIAYVGVGILPSEQDQGRLSPPRLSPPWSPSTPPPRRT